MVLVTGVPEAKTWLRPGCSLRSHSSLEYRSRAISDPDGSIPFTRIPVGHKIQFAESVRLIDIEEINPHVLEKDRLILCFGKTCLRAALGLFQTLFQTGAGNAVSAVLNGFFKLGEQILCHRFHSFRSSIRCA